MEIFDPPPPTDKKYFTLAEANQMLPLVKRIVADITTLAKSIQFKARLIEQPTEWTDPENRTEEELRDQISDDGDQLDVFIEELLQLGIELKDPVVGLIDFPCWSDSREIYLCWKHGEEKIEHWHETWAGFNGRQPIE